MTFPAVVAVTSLLLACSGGSKPETAAKLLLKERSTRALGSLPPGCLYNGRWYTDGVEVDTKEACLQCICHSGALTCRRKACAPLPDPPPRKCHIVYKKGGCCPELQCPEGVIIEHGATARSEDDYDVDLLPPTNVIPACVEGGTVYAAGSALRPTAACEACFCLHAERRCLRPKCLPPPSGCKPQPAPGACCPQRYYCHHTELHKNNTHDCEVNGSYIPEGHRVQSSEDNSCSQCFCLRGSVHCHTVQCAPPLRGCTPLIIPGECCPRQYYCEHGKEHHIMSAYKALNNALTELKNEDRSFHDTKQTRAETTTINTITKRSTPTTIVTNDSVATTKVKRKTEDPPHTTSTKISNITTTSVVMTTTDQIQLESTTEKVTEQPEETVKIMVNGTINCTAEISSTTIPFNNTKFNESMFFDAQPRIPILNSDDFEAQTYSPNDIITDRNMGFDESDTFTINVTSSLNSDASKAKPSIVSVPKPVINNFVVATNNSKKTKGDYDYDYTEPTLPPSLPNLKIIPFVAADAVVDDEAPKEKLTYPILEREDKFPVYYPTIDKETFTNRREDTYPPKYPVFVSEKETKYPTIHENVPNVFSNNNDLEYTAPSALGDAPKVVTAKPSKFEETAPAVGLFSPPVETEGGFIPKDPEAIDNYFAVYPTTQSTVSIPYLTTSMQLDITKECMTSDGRRVKEGGKISVWCSNCACHSGELRCTPRDCSVPGGCRRLPITPDAKDLCCGDLVCGSVSEEYTRSPMETTKKQIDNNTVKTENITLTKDDVTTPKNETEEIEKDHNEQVEVNSPKTDDVNLLTTTEKMTTVLIPETTPPQNDTNSGEYDDDDETSFGSLLQLLLSGEVESTVKPKTTKSTTKATPRTTLRPYRPTLTPFIPLPPRPFIPSKTVNRIDHLVLGEATAITTQKPEIKTNKPQINLTTKGSQSVQYTSVTHEGPRPPNLGLGGGILKISGCNIYGKMHRVGHFVPELSTNCQDCWCAEYGVQCKPKIC